MRVLMLAFVVACSTSVFAQDECPPGHVRHPPLQPIGANQQIDHALMLSHYRASFVGIHGREPTMVPGSGVDDGEYYIRQANHYGVYGDDQCHAGWSGYWESWLRNGHGDLALVQAPAHFQPTTTPPTPIPPQPTPVPPLDLSGVTAQLDAIAAELHEHVRADGDAHASINQNVSDGRAENRSFFEAVGRHWRSIAAIAGPIVTWYVTKRSVTP